MIGVSNLCQRRRRRVTDGFFFALNLFLLSSIISRMKKMKEQDRLIYFQIERTLFHHFSSYGYQADRTMVEK
jgi:hypothetical protein